MKKEVVIPIMRIPSAEEYGIPILIADALERRVVNENSIVRGKACLAARIDEQGLGEDLHIEQLMIDLEKLPR